MAASAPFPAWDPQAVLASPPIRLDYTIHSVSGVYAAFHPDYIRTDTPSSDTARWTAPPPDHRRTSPPTTTTSTTSSISNPHHAGPRRRRDPEWIILQLNQPALVSTIGFGKTTKPHPCNLADFTLWGGLTPDPLAMEPLLDGALKNDATPERFPLPISLPGTPPAPLPVRYLKLDCHVAANAAYSISIWHVFLEGYLALSCGLPGGLISSDALTAAYAGRRAQETTRLVLAHLRRQGPASLPAFRALLPLSASAGGNAAADALEHPLLTELHDAFVLRGDLPRTERLLDRLRTAGLLDRHVPGGGQGHSVARWTRLDSPLASGSGSESGSGLAPSGRGGHALVRVGRQLLLYGGWDGTRELDDLWAYDLDGDNTGWTCLDRGHGDGKGPWESSTGDPPTRPGPRSCHQMAVDERDGWVYLLGGRRDELDEDDEEDEEDGEDDDDDDDEEEEEGDEAGGDGTAGATGAMDLDEEDDNEEQQRPPLPASSSSSAPVPLSGTGPSRVSASGPDSDDGGHGGTRPGQALTRAQLRLERRAARWRSDFWRYRPASTAKEGLKGIKESGGSGGGTWELLSADTCDDGGPALVFDHAMVVQSSARRLLVFGGKNQPYEPDAAGSGPGRGGGSGAAAAAGAAAAGMGMGLTEDSEPPRMPAGGGVKREGRYSGLWSYDLETRTWTHLYGDPRPTSFVPRPVSPAPSSGERLLSRAGHALVLDESPATGDGPTLYVLHGQRNEQYLADEWAVRLPPAAAGSGGDGRSAGRDPPPMAFTAEPPLSGAGSLVDPAAFPTSYPSSSSPAWPPPLPSSSSSHPTLVQIRRVAPAPTPAGSVVGPDTTAGAGPPAGFTQRLTLGPQGTWTLLTGLGGAGAGMGIGAGSSAPVSPTATAAAATTSDRDRERERARERGEMAEERCMRGVWRRSGGEAGTWERVREEVGPWGEVESPRGRYAAQVVYDPVRSEHYLFGGCPEAPLPTESPSTRLGDFWKLQIIDPTPEEALRKAKFLVRKQRFTELCATAPTVLALQYLQNDLSLVVDHSSPTESAAFRGCMAQLLAAPARMNLDADVALATAASRPPTPTPGEEEEEEEEEGVGAGAGAGVVDDRTYRDRHARWEELCRLVPPEMRQPDERLEDAARLLRVWNTGGWGALGA